MSNGEKDRASDKKEELKLFLVSHMGPYSCWSLEVGPNAVLALKREGYRKGSFSLRDMAASLGYLGFWKMLVRHGRMAAAEVIRSLSKRRLARDLQRMVPEITAADITPGGAGVRAQALEPNGYLVDDFRIVEGDRMIHVLNAPSPAATASLSIGRAIAAMAERNFQLPR